MRRGALIGLGNVALHGHLPGWRRRRDVEIVGGTDARPEQRTVLVAHAPGTRWYPTTAELLSEAALDFVDICTPPASHAALIRSALERGLHVLCEKPLVGARDDLAPLARLAEKTGRVLYTVHNWHHAPIVRRTTELVDEGRIGRVNHVVWHTLRTRPAATGDERGGTGVLELRDDTLVLRGDARGADLAWSCPPAMSDGSHHPDWFDGVANQFLAEAAGTTPRGANLAEATLCAALERGPRASSLD